MQWERLDQLNVSGNTNPFHLTYQQYLDMLRQSPYPQPRHFPTNLCQCEQCLRGNVSQSPRSQAGPFQGAEEAELVAGTFKSLRAFRVAQRQGKMVLGPVSKWICYYENSSTWYSAQCGYRFDFDLRRWQTTFKEKHPKGVPGVACACGFYSFYSEEIMNREGSSYWNYGPILMAVAVVENAGRVLHGSLGLRSERMRILGIHVSDFTPMRRDYQFSELRMGSVHYEYADRGMRYRDMAKKVGELGLAFPLFPDVRSLLSRFPLDIPPD